MINGDSADTFCSRCEKDGGLLASLVLGVNKRHVRKSDETQDVAQVRLLKIESFLRRAFFIGTSAGSDDDDFLSCGAHFWHTPNQQLDKLLINDGPSTIVPFTRRPPTSADMTFPFGHARAHFVYHAGYFVSGDARVRNAGEEAFFRNYIAVTDSTGLHVKPHLSRARSAPAFGTCTAFIFAIWRLL